MTLLELMLALTLSAFLLVSITMAIDLNLRMLDARRGDVERIQVARAILQMIATDLRSAVEPSTVDFSALSSMAADAAAAGAGSASGSGDLSGQGSDEGGAEGGDAPMGGQDDVQLDSEAALQDMAASLSDEEASSTAGEIAASDTPPPVPGLYGNQYELQVDVSRLPRVDQMQQMVVASRMGPLQDIPSDVKTVAYFLHDPNSSTSTGDFRDAAGNPQAGLVRRALDRAVTLYASENSNAASLQDLGEVIAPEVGAIEFEYFDGMEWLYEWDSESQGGLPVAVRITLGLVPESMSKASDAEVLSGPTAALDGQLETYSLTVRLPTARPVEQEQSSAESSGMEAVGL
jgi:hypothetical protein